MSDTIADAVERLERALATRPGFGVRTTSSVSVLADGLRCVTEEDAWRIETDLTDRLGGGGSAPSPSTLLRAALGSCMAMSYRLRAARHDVPVTSVRVTVETESAVAGMLLPDSAEPAGFRSITYRVDIESPAPEADVLRVVDEGDLLSPVLDALRRTTTLCRTVEVSRPRRGAVA